MGESSGQKVAIHFESRKLWLQRGKSLYIFHVITSASESACVDLLFTEMLLQRGRPHQHVLFLCD